MNYLRPSSISAAIACLGLLTLLASPHMTRASGPWYVATTGNDIVNDCLTPSTPCANINSVLAKPGFTDGDTIRAAIGTYYGSGSVVLLLNRSVNVYGGWDATFTTQNGMSTIDGQGVLRCVLANSGANVVIDRLVIQNGSAAGGGGIFNSGAMVSIQNSIVRNNSGGTAWNGGGGIKNDGNMSISNSSIISNTALEAGGGILSTGILTVTNATISGNSGPGGFGGGIKITSGTLVLSNSTLSNNTAYSGGGIYLGWPSRALLQNSIVAGNIGLQDASECNMASIFTTRYNMFGYSRIGSCQSGVGGNDLINVPALLGPLQYNGGLTPTHALFPSSPAINGGDPEGCTDSDGNPLSSDQRGMPRVGRCDIGAYEFQSSISRSFLPLSVFPPLGLGGRVNLNGAGISGISLDLRFFNGSAWSTVATTTSSADGTYSFLNVPYLSPGQYYYVRYLNSTGPGRVCCWATRLLNSNSNGTTVASGNIDIADIALQSPNPGETISVYVPLQWATRYASPSDSYELDLYDPYNANTYWYSSPLGYTGSAAINHSLAGFNPHQLYAWYIGVFSPDGGYGESYYARGVYFDDTIKPGSQPEMLKPRNIPGSNERRIPVLLTR